ncbi:hypothetical protein [Pelagibacterium xiamenense]|uniref:hypothetical protein n=1 Tax=Pelagibacterium xiamenense TaxID=2901140 RepID=UPI001E37FC80|nr:hypothetical protein [Pelagibacterium xiamenense]MCD7058337.1 hypothetical protein [Pelagibacterium xiamenense]
MMELLVALLPVLILVALVVAVARWAQRAYKRLVDETSAANRAIADSNRELIAELREIKQILKDQN